MQQPSEIGSGLAEIYKVQTTSDGGGRVTLNFGHDSKDLLAKLLKKQMDFKISVFVAFVEDEE